jgi:hypothetical protein
VDGSRDPEPVAAIGGRSFTDISRDGNLLLVEKITRRAA